MAVIVNRLCCPEFLRPALHFQCFPVFFVRFSPFPTDQLTSSAHISTRKKQNENNLVEQIKRVNENRDSIGD